MAEPWIINIPLEVDEVDQSVSLSVDSDDEVINIHAEEAHELVVKDYRKLDHKPTINGTELYDNYDEIDPTMPNWAKGEEPETMTFNEIYDIWNSVF